MEGTLFGASILFRPTIVHLLYRLSFPVFFLSLLTRKMSFPFTMGYDFAGTIESLDESDRDKEFRVGDRVFGVNWGENRHDTEDYQPGGAFAEYIGLPLSKLSKIPKGVLFLFLSFFASCSSHLSLPRCYSHDKISRGSRRRAFPWWALRRTRASSATSSWSRVNAS